MKGLTQGRIVHYINADRQHQAAIVTGVVTGTFGHADLCVFASEGLSFALSVPPDLDPHNETRDSWHWPEHVA